MNSVLLTAGVVCVIAAVVGGGLKAFGIDVPVVNSLRRQFLLFVVGLGFLVAAWVLRDGGADGPDENVTEYRQRAAGSCERVVAISQAELPLDVLEVSASGVQFRKQPLLRELRSRRSAIAAELTSLWAVEAPAALQERRESAEQATGEWLRRFEERIGVLAENAPELLAQEDVEAFSETDDAALRATTNDAMTALAGQNCPVAG